MSGPVLTCREQQHSLFQLTMFEARLCLVLKLQRFYRWIWSMQLHNMHAAQL